MTTIGKAALIEHGARAEWEACWPSIPWPDDPDVTAEWRTSTAAALPVIAKALLAPLRELHYAADNDSARTPRCESCQGRAGVHGCGCWADEDRRPVCGVCNEGIKFQSVPWPCPTVRLLDAIEAEVVQP